VIKEGLYGPNPLVFKHESESGHRGLTIALRRVCQYLTAGRRTMGAAMSAGDHVALLRPPKVGTRLDPYAELP